ncbi:hypothetical protein [Streptomyces boluensis]|uniref:Uncharacterized protein n=1 Tax=Streptomyces boluensis TaxID=1775135 RepID=A0A964XRK6_9ACTN|nr:hypothetical protein [Streptomyces boluensis]NBE57127.1 hypothetical protein [Streptomyces boluensis]
MIRAKKVLVTLAIATAAFAGAAVLTAGAPQSGAAEVIAGDNHAPAPPASLA